VVIPCIKNVENRPAASLVGVGLFFHEQEVH